MKTNGVMNTQRSPQPVLEVAVIGSGFSGIGAGIKLKQAGFNNFVILERASDLGGTWRDNTYPGIAVDIASFSYSFSFEQNPNWSRVFAPGRELKAYADHCATKYGLRPHLRFNTEISRAVFDDARGEWALHTQTGDTIRARYLVSASGGLVCPKLPDIPGIPSFQGKVMHTARWDHSYDLTDKRVAIIGTGATSIQVVPSIAPKVRQLSVFQRTPIWLLPKPDAEISPWMKKLFRRLPITQTAFRMIMNVIVEIVMVLGVVYNKRFPWLIRWFERICLNHLAKQIPDPKLRAQLTPRYGFGCKRPSFSNDFYRAFNRPNVELVCDSIAEITPSGIRTADGRLREVDLLLLATGFKTFEKGNLPSFEVVGRGGIELADFWEKNRYQAYEGATVPGFPNFFMVLGPYSFTGASWFSMVEAQTTHLIRCLTEARKRGARTIEIRQRAHDNFFREILRRQKGTVFFNNKCSLANSYYFDRHGDAPFLRPASGLELWWQCRHFNLDHYCFT